LDVKAGSNKVEVTSVEPFRVHMPVCINPGGPNEEVAMVSGFGSLIFAAPLMFSHAAGEPVVPVVQEPYYTFKEQVDGVVGPMKKAARECEFGMLECFGRVRQGTSRLCGICGQEIGKVPTEFILQPWLVFLFFFISWLVLRHFNPVVNMIITALFAIACLCRITMWFLSGRQLGTLNRANMAAMFLLALIAAVCIASMLWVHGVRQYWWWLTGVTYQDMPYNGATTPAIARSDAAWLRFQDGSLSYPPSLVDTSRSAGYRDGDIYCAAPILSTEALEANSPLTLVQYWAIGVDCCQGTGSFTCDASRKSTGMYGMVLVDGEMSCSGCSHERFASAVSKAEALHNLVSADGALFVKWVQSPTTIRNRLGVRLFVVCFVIAVMALGATLLTAWLLYKIEKSIWDRQPAKHKYGPDGVQIKDTKPNVRQGIQNDMGNLKQMFYT
jgi:hypothetical protein